MSARNHDPRPSVNQGIDTNHPLVLQHTKIYNEAIAAVTASKDTPVVMLNPYGTAPLSGYIGFWSTTTDNVTIAILIDALHTPSSYIVTPVVGANLIPLLGLAPAVVNRITVRQRQVQHDFNVLTSSLPITDDLLPEYEAGSRFIGFPKVELTSRPVKPSGNVNHLYFCSIKGRANVGLDENGKVRWYTTLDLPAFNMERISNGHFMATDLEEQFEFTKRLYEFDLIGRVHKVYRFDNRYHHSIWQMPDGNLLIPSEYTGTTFEDGVGIIDINTGKELAYYDFRNVMDVKRRQVPYTQYENDWLHVNQCYINRTNNLIVTSARHQSAVFGTDVDTSELVFILANHQGWDAKFQKYLLTPIDNDERVIYDFTKQEDIDRADREFWNWGQHAVTEVSNTQKGMIEFTILDNGNWRSRDRTKAIIPNENWSRLVQYVVDLNKMTVRKVFEYGMDEVGPRGYSSFVSNAYQLDNYNYFVNFGGILVDENGRQITGTEYTHGSDVCDPLQGNYAEGMVILQEINPNTREVQVEFTLRSGRLKKPIEGLIYQEFFSFRARKHTLIP